MHLLFPSRAAHVVVLAGAAALAHAAEPAPPRLTLEQAIDEARARSPVLQAQRAEVEEAQARLLGARTYPFNPELTVEGNRRTNGVSTTDHGVRLGQEIEIGGQRGLRTAEAQAELDASRARLLHQERLLAARVQAAFVEALRVRELVKVEEANTELARSLAEVARKRLESGAAAQMEVNLAQVQVGRAQRGLRLTEGAHEVARTLLAEVVGLDPAQPPVVDGTLDPVPGELPALATLLGVARENRADLESWRQMAAAARARIDRSRREGVPNLEVEAFYGREAETDRLLGGALKIRIPVFDRKQGSIAEARAIERRTLADTEAAEIQVRGEVTAGLARYRASREASAEMERQVLGTLEENLGLLRRSFEAGKTGWTEVLVFRQEFVDIQRDYIETLAEARLAGIALDLAAGRVAVTTPEESRP